jgi:hypothetical protein
MQILRSNLDLSITEEAQLVEDILEVSKAHSYKIARKESARKSRERRKLKLPISDKYADRNMRKKFIRGTEYEL